MRRSVFFLCVLGFTCLIVGGVLALPSVRDRFSPTIRTFGTIAFPDGSPQPDDSPQQVSNETSLDLLGYAALFASVGFFGVAFLRNRRLA